MTRTFWIGLVIVAWGFSTIPSLPAQTDGGAPIYQRRSSVWDGGWQGGTAFQRFGNDPSRDGFTHRQGHSPQMHSPQSHGHHQQPTSYQQQSGFSFQRPYPYHLDYYRMKYGGSYAPYFGNLYGPPKVYAPTTIGGQPFAPYDHGGQPPPGEYYPPPVYGQAAPAYGQPMIVESVPAPTSQSTERAPVDPEPAAE